MLSVIPGERPWGATLDTQGTRCLYNWLTAKQTAKMKKAKIPFGCFPVSEAGTNLFSKSEVAYSELLKSAGIPVFCYRAQCFTHRG